MKKKKCSKCGEVCPAIATYFYRDNAMKTGLKQPCKLCTYKQRTSKEWREAQRVRLARWRAKVKGLAPKGEGE